MNRFTSFFNTLVRSGRSILAAGLLATSLLSALTLSGAVQFRTQAAATEVPGFGTYLRLNSASAPVAQHLDNLKAGDRVYVYLTVTNSNPNNTINDLQYYSAFAHEGVLSWIEPDGLGKYQSNNTLTYSVPNSLSLKYRSGSTMTATNRSGAWEFATIADNGSAESKTFSDSNDPNTGFHWTNVTGGSVNGTSYQYTVKYELDVVNSNTAQFNNHPEDVATFLVRKKGESAWHNSLSGLNNNDIVEFKVHVHNTKRGTKALNTRVGVSNWTNATAQNLSLTGFVDADNADAASSTVTLSSGQNFKLEYVPGSTRFQGRPSVNASPYDPNQARPDGITGASGIEIGDVGDVEGCWDFQVIAIFQAKVRREVITTPSPTPTVTPSPTPTVTPSPTPTPSPSPTPSITPSPSPSPTPSVTPSPSPTPTPTVTPSPSPTPTVTPSPSPTPTPQGEHTGFVIEKYDDHDGDGSRDNGEAGLDWEFEWQKKGESGWNSYQTYASQNGRGGTIGGRSTGEVIIVREKGKGGWRATTSEEVTLTMAFNEIKVAVFGNQRIQPTKPAATTTATPSELPKTGSAGEVGLAVSLSLAGLGGVLSWLQRKLS